MNNKKSGTKRTLITSLLSLMICVTMLIGTTFAWFTDSVTSSGNKIQAGNLKIDLEVLNAEGEYISVRDMEDPIFNYTLWEPGYTQVKTFKIVNEGNLALKYQLNVVAEKADCILANVIDVYMCFGESNAKSAADLSDTGKWWKCGTLAEMMAKSDGFTQGKLLPKGAAYDGDQLGENGVAIGEITASIALHMQETAGNEYQGLDLGNIDINLLATQFTYEEDSFGTDYDADATYEETPSVDAVEVNTVEELATAVENGENIKLTQSITVNALTIPDNKDVTINLNGNNLTAAPQLFGSTALTVNGKLTIAGNGGLIVSPEMFVGMGISVANTGCLIIDDGDFSFSGVQGNFGSISGELIINGGNFVGTGNVSLFNTSDSAKLTITGGTFNSLPFAIREDNRIISISGGTFNTEVPQEWLKEGYICVERDGSYIVVAE